MTAAIIPFPQDLTGERRTDLRAPCVVMVLPVVRIERHDDEPPFGTEHLDEVVLISPITEERISSLLDELHEALAH